MQKCKHLCVIFLFTLFVTNGWAFTPFTVSKIQFQGLQGISRSTISDYLPIAPGQQLTNTKSTRVIQSLYNTGFFQDVRLARRGNILIINVQERPTISDIKIIGNKEIKTKRLLDVMRKLGITEGQVYNKTTLARIKLSLEAQYNQLGKFSAKVNTIVTPLPRNRVSITISITEGVVTKIARIQIIGNHAFSQHELLGQFKLGPPNLLSFFTSNDHYSKEKLDKDLQSLHDFYLDHGFIRFQIVSHKVSLTPDKQHVFITITISEGSQYKLSGYRLMGNLMLPQGDFTKYIDLPTPQIFSRKKIIAVQKVIGDVLGNHGYAYAMVQVIPTVDEKNKTVFINFDIEPGRRVYIRHINFSGNTKTEDIALRKAMVQLEGGLYNLSQIDDSERNINILGIVKNVHHEITPVAGKNNQVDLNMGLTEMPTATVTAGVGYSTTEKVLISSSLKQPNFMGTGKALDVNFSNSAYTRTYSLSFNDPYYTLDGVSRGYSLFYQRYNPSKAAFLGGSYTYNIYGGNINFGIPLNMYNRINLGVGYQHIKLLTSNINIPQYVTNFLIQHNGKRRYNEILLSASYLFNNWDRAIFPTKGIEATAGGSVYLPASKRSLKYYKLSTMLQGYLPLNHQRSWIIYTKAGAVYGNGLGSTNKLPFFANYYGGGIDSDVPLEGLEPNSLGPWDEFRNSIGGNFGVYGKLGLIIPQFTDSVRTMVFIDMGKLFETKPSQTQFTPTFTTTDNNGNANGTVIYPTTSYAQLQSYRNAHRMRFSYGVSVEWRSFIGPLVFSLSRPFKTYCPPAGVTTYPFCDQTDPFQFTVGANF